MTTAIDRNAGTIPSDTFANRLMLSRAQAGHLSIREAAERCGLGRGAWQNWEKGTRPDDYEALVELIADRLGIDPVWLRDGGSLSRADAQVRPARWARGARQPRTLGYPPMRPVDNRPRSRAGRPGPSSTRTHRVRS
jgi:transcriptional regulator with XRE-family HTH domain